MVLSHQTRKPSAGRSSAGRPTPPAPKHARAAVRSRSTPVRTAHVRPLGSRTTRKPQAPASQPHAPPARPTPSHAARSQAEQGCPSGAPGDRAGCTVYCYLCYCCYCCCLTVLSFSLLLLLSFPPLSLSLSLPLSLSPSLPLSLSFSLPPDLPLSLSPHLTVTQ